MEDDRYYSISVKGESLYKEKGSKFIGIALAVKSENEFKLEQESLKKHFHDARHICYAFKIGIEDEFIGKSDDGEPLHSAGDPILGQITARELKNTAVFVIRYFGGVKLGVGGLKQAYKAAANSALDNSKIKSCVISENFKIYFSYSNSAMVMKLIGEYNASILEQKYDEHCYLKVQVRRSQSSKFKQELLKLEYLGIHLELEE